MKNFIPSLIHPLPWSDLHGIGNSSLARATIIIPILGYFIIFNDKLIDFLTLDEKFVWNSNLTTSLNLFFFYFGMTFISLGSLFYYFLCPTLIKTDPDQSRYVNIQRDNFDLPEIEHFRGFVKENHERMLKNKKDYKGSKFAEVVEEAISTLDPSPKTLLAVGWVIENSRNKVGRYFTYYSYVIGFALVAIPTIDTFIRVCIAFVKKLFG